MNNAILLTPKEAAQRLRISIDTIYAWARSGKIPTIRLGRKTLRIAEGEIDRLVEISGNGTSAATANGE